MAYGFKSHPAHHRFYAFIMKDRKLKPKREAAKPDKKNGTLEVTNGEKIIH